MVTKFPEINQQASPHIPQSANYTEQGRRAGNMGPELGRTQHEHVGDHHRQQHIRPHPLPLPLPHSLPHPHSLTLPHSLFHPHTQPHPRSFPPPHYHEMNEVMQREIEKEQIREEIIMSEIVRRRALEAEVRRELMMERELALQRGSNGFSFGSSSVSGFDSPTRLPLLGTRAEGLSLEERIVLSLSETKRLNGRCESGGFETLPLPRRSADLKISDVKTVSEGGNQKEKIILLAKQDENISGSKRKAVTPPAGVDASESPSDVILRKKAKEEWSCAICQVSTTSEPALNEHLKGKKHKSKEAALRAHRGGKNFSIGLFPKKVTKSTEVLEAGNPGASENLNSDDSKKNQSEVQKKDDPKKKNYRFWCELCQVGTISQKVMNAHKRGKKHARRQEASNRNGGANQKKIIVLVNREGVVDEDGKNLASEDVDEALKEAGSEVHVAMDAVEQEDHEPLDETKADDGVAVDITKGDDELTEPGVADEPKVDEQTVS